MKLSKNQGWSDRQVGLIATSATVGAVVATVGLTGIAGISAYLARKVVVPPRRPVETQKVVGLGFSTATPATKDQPTTITFEASAATLAPGRYGFFFDAGSSFARLGEIISYDPVLKTVTRQVEQVITGNLREAKYGRISGIIHQSPQEAGYQAKNITLVLEDGAAPAWLIPPQTSEGQPPIQKSSKTWAIMIHGMGTSRSETLRALGATGALGMTSLHISYRNDKEAPASQDGRYGLGFTEWKDVEVAIAYALRHGAEQIVLFGWSMGGAIALQTADRAANKTAIKALVLDGPAVDWLELINYHTRLNKMPLRVGALGISMISNPLLTVFTGLKNPIKLERLSWLHRAEDIKVPTLIIHSLEDWFVPAEPSRILAEKSALVDFVPFEKATHTREWNVDPALWTRTVISWLDKKLS